MYRWGWDMTDLRAILISVDYSDLLSVSLPYNRHHFSEVMVVTSPGDTESQRVARETDAQVYVTDSFYKDGALFNKWLALEEALGVFGRHGWMVLMDADVLWPRVLPCWYKEVGCLYTPKRRMLHDVTELLDKKDRKNTQYQIPDENDWVNYPLHPQQVEWAGYTQIFHADDEHLPKPPWHEVDWTHAGGADSIFQARWPSECKVRPPWEVLHLGDAGYNWGGRSTPYVDGTRHPKAEQRRIALRELILQRRNKRGEDRFSAEKIIKMGIGGEGVVGLST